MTLFNFTCSFDAAYKPLLLSSSSNHRYCHFRRHCQHCRPHRHPHYHQRNNHYQLYILLCVLNRQKIRQTLA